MSAGTGDHRLKRAEANSYLGDDLAVIEDFEAAGNAGQLPGTMSDALFFHLAAVAHARLGHETEGRLIPHLRTGRKYIPKTRFFATTGPN